jgi:hypothetical protein
MLSGMDKAKLMSLKRSEDQAAIIFERLSEPCHLNKSYQLLVCVQIQ